MKVNLGGVDKLNSEFAQRDLKRIKDTDKKSTASFASEDKVEISSKALDLKAMSEAAMKTPDVRTEKVEALKVQVESGQYQVSPEKLAERLIEENILE